MEKTYQMTAREANVREREKEHRIEELSQQVTCASRRTHKHASWHSTGRIIFSSQFAVDIHTLVQTAASDWHRTRVVWLQCDMHSWLITGLDFPCCASVLVCSHSSKHYANACTIIIVCESTVNLYPTRRNFVLVNLSFFSSFLSVSLNLCDFPLLVRAQNIQS